MIRVAVRVRGEREVSGGVFLEPLVTAFLTLTFTFVSIYQSFHTITIVKNMLIMN